MEKDFTRNYLLYLFIFLGALSAFPPLVTDMYLPALPAMTRDFNTSPSGIQLGLALCIIGLAAGQLLFGPLSDKYGRRPVIGTALILFVAATICCIFSTNILAFNICRFFQGLAGAGGVVLSRSIATDCYSGRELAKALAIIGAINGIAPVTAPVVGGLFAEAIGWKGIFCILLGLGRFLLLFYLPFKESHLKEHRYTGSITGLMKQGTTLLKNRTFLKFAILCGLSNGVLFGYISSASFILQNDFGLSELMFGVVFAINSVAIGLGSMISLKFRNLPDAIRCGGAGMLICSAGMFAFHHFYPGLAGFEICAFIILFCVGLVFPSATTIGMTEGKEMVGWASAIIGATGFTFGGIIAPMVGIGNIQVTTYTSLLVCSLLIVLISAVKTNDSKIKK